MNILKDFFRFGKIKGIIIVFLSIILGFSNFYLLYLIFKISDLIYKTDVILIKYVGLLCLNLLINYSFKLIIKYLLIIKIRNEEQFYYKLIYLQRNIKLKDLEDEKNLDIYKLLDQWLEDRESISNKLIRNITNVVFLIMSYTYILSIDINLSLLYFITICLYYLFNKLLKNKTKNIWLNYNSNMRIANNFNNILIDKDHLFERDLFSYHSFIQEKFKNSHNNASFLNKYEGKKKLKYDLYLSISSILSSCILLLVLAIFYKNNEISFTKYTLIFFLKLNSDGLIESILSNNVFLYKYVQGLEYIEKITKSKFDNHSNLHIDNNKYEIIFDKVYFKYPNSSEYTIYNFSYKFHDDKFYLIVGENGEGKSTLIKLLLGLYKPSSGRVTINGVDTYKLTPDMKRKVFSCLLQDSSKYPFTIKENINLGHNFNSAYSSEVTAMLKQFSKGEDSNLSILDKEPINLSKGQWQKVFMERLYKDSNKILILDEPTASLDPINEYKFYKEIKNYTNNSLGIFISHRMGIVGISDEILVLKNGELVEEGDFDKLIRMKGYFYEIYISQRNLYK